MSTRTTERATSRRRTIPDDGAALDLPFDPHDLAAEAVCDGRDPFGTLDSDPLADRLDPDDVFLDEPDLLDER